MHTPPAPKLRFWKPLLKREDAPAVLASLEEISAALEADLQSSKPDLGQGAAGIAIFFAYSHLAGVFPGARELALRCVDMSAGALASQTMGPSLFTGFSGIAWAVQHVNDLLIGSDEDLCGQIDLALESYLDRSPWIADYDLISGLVGLGVYCLERDGSPVAAHCLELIVQRLDELAEPSGDGLRWFTPPSLMASYQLATFPDGNYNLGVAHGVPGILALLGKIQAAGIARQKADRLLQGGVRWLLEQQLPQGFASSFASFVAPGLPLGHSRLAWCYGDAGLAAALLLAARSTSDRVLEQHALSIAHKAAVREPQSGGVIDCCFCHGSAGLAHIFNRFYQATADERFSFAARFWIERTLEFRHPGTGAAGYSVMTNDDDGGGEIALRGRLGVIEGIAGVGLTLLAAVTGVEPRWDSIFLVDIPPRIEQP